MSAVLREGFETGDVVSSGWIKVGSSNVQVVTNYSTSLNPRADFNGNGGSYFAAENGAAKSRKSFKRDATEFFIRFGWSTPNLFLNNSGIRFLDSGTGDEHLSILGKGGNPNSVFEVRTGANLVRGDSTVGSLIQADEWHAWSAHIRIDNLNGFIRLYRDHDYSTEWFSYAGDVQDSTSTVVNALTLEFDSSGKTACDDISINDITMTYSLGSGTLPVAGDTITGQTSGATAVITAILPGSNATSGTFQLRTVQNSGSLDWNGLIASDPFQAETIDDSASSNLWSGTITGLDKNSGFPNDGYIIGLVPNADVIGSIQLLGSDGDSLNNNLLVDETPSNDADYVGTTISGNRDMYELTNFPLVSGDISEIKAVELNVKWLRTDATLNNGRVIVEHSLVEHDSNPVGLTTIATGHSEIYDKIPDGTDWTVANVDSLRVGVKFET